MMRLLLIIARWLGLRCPCLNETTSIHHVGGMQPPAPADAAYPADAACGGSADACRAREFRDSSAPGVSDSTAGDRDRNDAARPM